ncbi:hypothetical protein P4S83_08510 [Aneurinibacillus thermoaerophilus]|uniref:hypothetical protein n=1 Tax=Aneurinibacillus thermoaerophilus TaxID=143495 RepID=UPI002E1AF716|nr:hypothetical protein [Aneurinibacillus thermoaerophilus]MED0763823.1 hypothetical protein [Aneurinibacillus thermoaerophilus]
MNSFHYPAMPMYSHDHATYCRQMYEWHTKMAQYHDQKKAYHMERAKQFQQLRPINTAAKKNPEDIVA